MNWPSTRILWNVCAWTLIIHKEHLDFFSHTCLKYKNSWNKKEPHKIYKYFDCAPFLIIMYIVFCSYVLSKAIKYILNTYKCKLKWLCFNWCHFINLSALVGLSWNLQLMKCGKRINYEIFVHAAYFVI